MKKNENNMLFLFNYEIIRTQNACIIIYYISNFNIFLELLSFCYNIIDDYGNK
jgi:hypothetical protein